MSTKNFFLFLWIISGVCSMHAAASGTFEIQNKADSRSIWVGLINGDTIVFPTPIEVPSLQKAGRSAPRPAANIDINKPTKLFVWLTNPQVLETGGFATKVARELVRAGQKVVGTEESQFAASRPANYVYRFTPGKTIYLTWDKRNFARPQTGPLKGFAFVTETGLSLRNNVEVGDIILEKKK